MWIRSTARQVDAVLNEKNGKKEKKMGEDTPPPPSAGQTASSDGREVNRAAREGFLGRRWCRLRNHPKRPGRLGLFASKIDSDVTFVK
jgi:hypothetical protein